MSPEGSSETIHATSVALGGRAVLIVGPSGAGKSDLALRLIDRGFALVSDDQTIVTRESGRLVAAPPPTIAGKIEVRGIGIVETAYVPGVPVALVVELTSDIERLPQEPRERSLLGIAVPLVSVDARSPSAAVKVGLALERFGARP